MNATQINQLIDIAKKVNNIAEMLNMKPLQHNIMTRADGADGYSLKVIQYSDGDDYWTVEFKMYTLSGIRLCFEYKAHEHPEFNMSTSLIGHAGEFLKDVKSLYRDYTDGVKASLQAKLEQDLQSL